MAPALLSRGLYDGPPPEKFAFWHAKPTLLFSWWCTGVALLTILLRLCGRMVRNNELFREDKIMLWSMVPLLARMALVHVVLLWGTNNVDISGGLSDVEIYDRSMGSRLVLASRVFYALFIWMCKWTVSEFLKRLTNSYWKRSYEIWLHAIRIFLVVTFIGVVITILGECQPFTHYWQVVPDPGPQCRKNYAQLFTMGIADSITDVLLIVFPISIIVRSNMALLRKFKLCLLFSLNAVLIVVTTQRIVSVISHRGRQQIRTVYASGEILAAAAVSNVLILGSFLRDRGVKKAKFSRTHSRTNSDEQGPPSRRVTMTHFNNESDLDLFAGMCYRTAHDDPEAVPRAPPIVGGPDHDIDADDKFSSSDEKWHHASFQDDDDITLAREPTLPMPPEAKLAKTVTFSDPGGLLDNASSQASTIIGSPLSDTYGRRWSRGRQESIAESSSGGYDPEQRTRAGSRIDEFHDIGGLLK